MVRAELKVMETFLVCNNFIQYSLNYFHLAFMQYFDNPRGSIPTWLINWGASTGVPDFLTKMEKACEGYQAYKLTL